MINTDEEQIEIDKYLINLALLVDSKGNDNEKKEIINSFKEYLSIICQSEISLNNLFKILENLLFQINENNQITINKVILVLYPLIFSYNPMHLYKYIDNFLLIIKKCLIINDIQFLCHIFNEIINIYFKDSMNDNESSVSSEYTSNDSTSIDKKKKEELYKKMLNFCANIIENDNNCKKLKNEKSIGCVFLYILIDKYNVINNEKIINDLWNIISYFFNDKNFNYIYDLLFCTIKLIIASKEKFGVYCNLCLFSILDYLTDDDWKIRKISIEIIYLLTNYCKAEILSVKDNIIEFLNILKDDKVPQVKEICLMTLNFIEGKANFRHDFQKFLSIRNNSENDFNFNFNHIINQQSGCGRPELSISFSENNGNISKEDISFSDQRININNNNNNNHIIDNYFNKNIDLNEIKENDENNDKLNDENEFNRFLKCRNYSCDINKNLDFNLEKTEQPKYKTIKKKSNLNKCNNNKESNGDNSFRISKLSYNIIQKSTKQNTKFKNKFKDYLDISYSIPKKNIKDSEGQNKTQSILKIKTENNENKNKKFIKNKKYNLNIRSKLNNNNISNLNKSSINIFKKGNEISKENMYKNNIAKKSKNYYSIKPNKSRDNILISNKSKDKFNKTNNNNLVTEENKDDKKIINSNNNNKLIYLNIKNKRSYEKRKVSNQSYILNEKKNIRNNNNKTTVKIEKTKYKQFNNSQISPKINLMTLFTSDNINNNNHLLNPLTNNNIQKNVTQNINNSNSNSNNIQTITDQLNTLYKGQNMLLDIVNNLQNKVNNNYKSITERLVSYENNNSVKIKKKIEKDKKWERIKNSYIETRYNEALLEGIKNDIYLFKLLPLIKIEDLNKINISLIEDIVSRLSIKLPSILKNQNRFYFGIILSFLNLVVNSKINLKIVTKLNLKDSLNYIKKDYQYFKISEINLKLIDNIIKLIKK